MKEDKISVIIPVYNASNYIEHCIDSVINQTYDNLEVICIDDGSIDNSFEILNRYAKKDNRIRIFRKENGGSANARNTGLDAASGDWITFVDNDDWLDLDMYESLIQFGKDNPADILACGYYFSFPDKEVEAVNRLLVPSGTQKIEQFLFYIYCRDDYKGVSSYIWNKLFSAKLINRNEGKVRFDNSLGNLGDDIDWAARCYMHAKTIAYIPKAMYHHRERSDSAFHAFDHRLENMQHIRAYEKIIALYEKHHIDDSVLDYVKRFYVYHLGFLADYAIKTGKTEKIEVLRNKAQPYLHIYIQTNKEYPERIAWISHLFGVE